MMAGASTPALHDRAFDRGLLAFDDNQRLLLSAKLRLASAGNPVAEANFLRLEGQPLRLPHRFLPDMDALAWHREHVFAKIAA